jgi:hypothetical protein
VFHRETMVYLLGALLEYVEHRPRCKHEEVCTCGLYELRADVNRELERLDGHVSMPIWEQLKSPLQELPDEERALWTAKAIGIDPCEE